MRKAGISPDNRTFVTVIQACGMLADDEAGNLGCESTKGKFLEVEFALHADAWRSGYDLHTFVASSLVVMYGKWSCISNARNAFLDCHGCKVVLWNAMLTAHVQQGQSVRALQLYEQMWEEA